MIGLHGERERNILLIVEGERAEPRVLNRLFDLLNLSAEYLIHPYGTVLHNLLERIAVDYENDFESIEIIRLLAELDPNNSRNSMLLGTRFTDVVLIFDFDPQDDRFDASRLFQFMRAFSDSTDTDRGKLFINYPMLESYRDFKQLDDMSYLEKRVSKDQLIEPGYKALVSALPPLFTGPEKMNARDFVGVIALNVSKAQHVLRVAVGDGSLVWSRDTRLSEACCELDLLELLDLQIAAYMDKGYVWVCSTFLFFCCENWPERIDAIWKRLCT